QARGRGGARGSLPLPADRELRPEGPSDDREDRGAGREGGGGGGLLPLPPGGRGREPGQARGGPPPAPGAAGGGEGGGRGVGGALGDGGGRAGGEPRAVAPPPCPWVPAQEPLGPSAGVVLDAHVACQLAARRRRPTSAAVRCASRWARSTAAPASVSR